MKSEEILEELYLEAVSLIENNKIEKFSKDVKKNVDILISKIDKINLYYQH